MYETHKHLLIRLALASSVFATSFLLIGPGVSSAQEEAKPADVPSEAAQIPKDEKPKDEKPMQEKAAEPESEEKKADAKKQSEAEKKPEADEKPTSEDPALEQEWINKGVFLTPPKDGPVAIDFNLVGEYVGEINSSDDKTNPFGIQIRALGDGQFEARAYQGGLPGQPNFTEKESLVLIGRRSGDTLVLSGGPWALFAGKTECRIINSDGKSLGTLPRTGRSSPTMGAKAPEGAVVLFDGTNTDAFTKGEMTPHGLLKQGADVNYMLGDFDLHFEFKIPYMPKFTDQARGNSGLYLQSRYECQVLDSFGDARVFNGLGALYRHRAPDFNMALPPLVWQTYDIHFTAARFAADGSKLRNAHVTSWVNGVKVQDNQPLPGPTGHGQAESATLLPTLIQDHNDPVRFRNVWAIDRGITGGIEFPVK